MAVKLNQHDLEFILDQIKIAEAHAAGTPLDQLIVQPHLPYGLRTVDGSYNNLTPGRELWGASDQIMPRMLAPNWSNEQDEDTVDINGPDGAPGDPNDPADDVNNTDYGVNGSTTGGSNGGHTGHVIDSDPRIISNLVVDQTLKNPAAIMAALKYAEVGGTGAEILAIVDEIQGLHEAYVEAAANSGDATAELAALEAALTGYGIEMDGNTVLLPNVAPDEGLSAPFNGWMTFFGQFFDHGLDLIHKGDNGTIWVPLAADDPLRTHGPDGIAGSGDEVPDHMAFMALARLKPEAGPGADGVLGTADDTMEARNKTTPFVDQNQTYTSHPSHQVFLREYEMVDGKPMATGHLLDGVNGGLATWADVKLQAAEKLGIVLSDLDVLGVPLLRTDAYGEFIRGEDGFPQVVYNIGPDLIPNTDDDLTVSASPGNPVVLADINGGLGPVLTSHQFIDDIAHNANPMGTINGVPAILQPDINSDTDPLGNPLPPDDFGNPVYDNELLDKHFITGDGRGNENIGLTTVHHVFHAEHNRQVEDVKKQILDIAESGLDADIAFLNEWLLGPDVVAGFDPQTLQWDGERLFQVGRFATEMQYQHLVFEEFGRKVQPNIDLFVFNTTTDVNPAIFAEFAHTVYRFGHSMLTDHLKLLPLNEDGVPVDANGNVVSANNWGVDVGLIEAFLNPVLYDQNGGITAEQAAGAIARGMTYVHANAIDEFVTESLRNNLLGLPLDLAAINIARARDAGVPSLNEAREQLYAASNSTWLKPYESWADFGANLKTPASIINFIAAYGTHDLILSADTLEDKREAAMQLLGLSEPTDIVALTVTNDGFETNSLASGAPGVITHVNGNYTTTAPDGWTLTGQGGLIAPAPGIVDPSGVEGDNVAWIRQGAALSQVTGVTLEEGVSYRLTLDFGDRTDLGWPGGTALLRASNGDILATVALTAPADGSWSTVVVETPLIGAAHDSQGLSIEIVHAGGTADQILIDNVRLDVLQPVDINDRIDFLNGTGTWAGVETGLNHVDLWIGGLAEKIMPFGGMLGSTFNAVFELQMENLQEGDRFYYLSRTQGLNLLNELENNAFAKMIMANTDLAMPGPDGIRGTEDDIVTHHIGLDSFAKYDGVLEVNLDAQIAADADFGENDPFLEALRAKVQRDDPSTGVNEELLGNYLRFTGGEHMVMGGTEDADTIIGGDGDDGIWGGDGDDRIEGGHGVDLISAGAGDDIVTDTGDTGDFIKGESGDDVIANSNGLDVLMGGDGKDVFFAGVDATEMFGGEGDDFMLGGLDHDFFLGNEGDDWMEGGDGFDVINGDNSELFFNSTILGHDVAFAGANENDFDMESGDDIMVQGESVMRNEGMFGFDWAIYKGSEVAADADMRIPFFTTVFDDILRDRFDQVEALSGWDKNDILRGDDRGQDEEIEVELQMAENHYLSWAGVDRIDGLQELLGLSDDDRPADDPNIDLEKAVAWTAGNLLIGGDGSDLIEGRGGDDFIHGDAWLNVRIRIVGVDGDGNALDNDADNEIATVDTLTHVFQAGDVDSNNDPIPTDWHGKSLSELLLTRVIKPSQMHIQREIKYDEDTSNDTDTAIFAGNQAWYEITHLDDGGVRVARREMEEVDPQISEGTDTLYGIERILFNDGIYTIRQTGNEDPTGRLTIIGLPATEDGPLTVNATAIRDLNNPDGMVSEGAITYRWQVERNDGTGDYIDIPGVSGNSFTPDDDHVGLRIRVIGTYIDAGGVIEVVSSQPTDVVLNVNDDPAGPVLLSDMSPTEGQVLTATAAFSDGDGITDAFEEALLTYQWQYFDPGNAADVGDPARPDTVIAGDGWVEVPAEQGGNDRSFTPGPDHVGKPLRVVVDYEDDGGTTEQRISAETEIVGNRIEADLLAIDGTQGDAEGGTNAGADWVLAGGASSTISGGAGGDYIHAGGGNDIVNGGAGNDVLDGGAGDDTLFGEEGNDRVIHRVGEGAGSADGGAGNDAFRIEGANPGTDDIVTIVRNGGVVTAAGGVTVTNFESFEADAGAGIDTLAYSTIDDDVSVNLLSGAATGMSFTRGFENVVTGGGDDTLQGNSLANALSAGGGNDEVRGGFGDDVLGGAGGNDNLYGDEGDDLLYGGAGDDRIDGGAGSDTASYRFASGAVTVSLAGTPSVPSFEPQNTLGDGWDRLVSIENLTGSNFGDTLTGDDGANVIDGGAGNDTMAGGEGNDTYVVAQAGDVVTEAENEGDDTILADIENLTLASNVENLVLGTGIAAGNGNALDNRLTGNAEDNALDGGGGNDTIVLSGAVQDYEFGFVNATTFTTQSAAGGTDTLSNIERAEIKGVVYNLVRGTNGANAALIGTAAADLVLGFNGGDTMTGADGDDILVGGAGNDWMAGGAGNDTYVVNNGGDIVTENVAGSDGVDTIITSVTRNLANAAQVAGAVENVTLIGSGNINALGNAENNVMTGNSGDNILTGAAGTDTLIGNAGNDDLRGGAGNDELAGGDGDDLLNGQGGAGDVAVFEGPAGNYTFGFNGNALSTVTDIVGNGGTDTLTNIELVRFGDGPNLGIVTGDGDITATAPSIIFGGDGDDDIIGSTGGDIIIGGAGDDTLSGYDVGTADDDVVPPHTDDDTFIWRVGDGQDFINGGGEGVEGDLFQIVGNGEAETYRIYTEVEAVARGFALAGEEPEIFVTRQVEGGEEVVIAQMLEIEEIMINGNGVSGDADLGNGDTVEMYGDFDVDTSLRPNTITIVGSSGDDTVNISSLLSNHRIVFKTNGGNDTIIGTLREQDVVVLASGTTIGDYVSTTNEDGTTTIATDGHSVTYNSSGTPQFTSSDVGADAEPDEVETSPPPIGEDVEEAPTGDNGEVVSDDQAVDTTTPPATGDDGDATGPLLSGTPGADVLTGTDLADHLIGFEGDDVLIGLGGKDVLVAGAGNDFLSGWADDDMIFGDAGDDTILGGDGDDILYGNDGADRIMADAGDDLVDAGAGNDSVVGGAGDDVFVAAAGDGNDVYFGDELNGGNGIDMLDMRAVSSATTVDLGSGLQGLGSAISAQSGHDTLWGIENVATGAGADHITASNAVNVIDGGTGDDTFHFKSIAAADGDTIVGFEAGDKIDLSMIDADGDASFGNKAFTLANGSATALAQLVITQENLNGDAYTVIRGHVSDTEAPDFTIRIEGTHDLNANNFDL